MSACRKFEGEPCPFPMTCAVDGCVRLHEIAQLAPPRVVPADDRPRPFGLSPRPFGTTTTQGGVPVPPAHTYAAVHEDQVVATAASIGGVIDLALSTQKVTFAAIQNGDVTIWERVGTGIVTFEVDA